MNYRTAKLPYIILRRKLSLKQERKLLINIDKMDFVVAGPSNGVGPPRKKAKQLVTRDYTKRDLASLPKGVLLRIFGYLDLQSINNCAMLCSTFYNLSKENSLYTTVILKYNMNPDFLESLISRVSHPKAVSIKYKPFDQHAEKGDCTAFDKYVERLFRKCGEHILSLKIEGCRSDRVLQNLIECISLKRLTLYRCKSSFDALTSLHGLSSISFTSCHFPQKVVSELIRLNLDLKYLFLSNNINVNANEICEIMSKENPEMKEIYFNERKRVRSKSLRTLARLTNLRKLVLKSGLGFECDPEDALELLAAGCCHLDVFYHPQSQFPNHDQIYKAVNQSKYFAEYSLINKCCSYYAMSPVFLAFNVVGAVKCIGYILSYVGCDQFSSGRQHSFGGGGVILVIYHSNVSSQVKNSETILKFHSIFRHCQKCSFNDIITFYLPLSIMFICISFGG